MIMNYFAIIAIVAAIFIAERSIVNLLTYYPGGRQWLREHRLFHPNAISIIRIPMGLAAVGLWSFGFPGLGICWFAFWMITDLTDGTIARRCGLVTKTGDWLDPLSDKLLYFPALLFFSWHGLLLWYWVVPFVLIDTFGQFSRLLVKKKAANIFGKSKTALITVLLILTAFHKLALENGAENIFTAAIFPDFLAYLMICATLLAFLSVYCKVIPDIWYANSLTLANFACGAVAVYYVVQGHSLFAFILVFIGQFFDLFDGRLARKFGSTQHGAFYDDVADGTSFGLAVAFIIYFQFGRTWPALIIAGLYLAAVIFRLIRFLEHRDRLDPAYFEGIPTPAGALLAGSVSLLFTHLSSLGLALVLLSAGLMVSRLTYRHFARKMWRETPNMFKVMVCLVVLLLVSRTLADQEYQLTFKIIAFILACLYLLFGNERVVQWINRQWSDERESS